MKAGRSYRRWFLGFPLVVLLLAAACATAKKPAASKSFFQPPVPTPSSAMILDANPPPVEPSLSLSLYDDELPDFLAASARSIPGPSSVEAVLQRADARYQAGRRLFRAGQREAARREFDRAVDILLVGPTAASARQELDNKLTELAEAIHQYDVSGLGAGVPDDEPIFEKSPLEEIPEPTFPIDPKLRDRVAEELKAAASQLPLEVNDDVLRYINYFSTERGRKTLVAGLKRAGRYHSLIRRILDEEGIPQELIHLAQAESGFAPRAVSRKKATGMWQFVLFRGQQYGLFRTPAKDDRLDPELATRAAARHLHDLYTMFGDWYLAMSAYNCGPGAVQRAVERTGYADFWELRRRRVLPRETSNYVPIILAMAIMAKNPGHYGLENIEAEPPLEYSTIELDAPVQLALIADIVERPVSELRQLNPALLGNVAPAGYSLHLPEQASATVLSALELIPASRRTAWRLYRVSEGDTLASIAQLYRTTPRQIAEANTALGSTAEPGSLLIVPAPQPAPARRAARVRAARRPPAATRAAAKPAAVAKTGAKRRTTATKSALKSGTAASGAALVAAKKAPVKRSSSAIR